MPKEDLRGFFSDDFEIRKAHSYRTAYILTNDPIELFDLFVSGVSERVAVLRHKFDGTYDVVVDKAYISPDLAPEIETRFINWKEDKDRAAKEYWEYRDEVKKKRIKEAMERLAAL